ncbi:N-terminal nucleophile aminohydrolase [Polyplosphaeria fusca]|uniref:N-terminal nucleophile aminohydrolase n=1 Tax=Polyplosphaeria fusca TaxID=682080 RepID=A0A9P4QVZ8_9PLEO|nr:N-terminal nucleophile aminohydrolase [Polyplosphaeria fusca]
MATSTAKPRVTPRIIIHGGAGNITKSTVDKQQYNAYDASLRKILSVSAQLLSAPDAKALDVATHAVTMLEDDTLYNSGKGAVFTRAGTNELECSIMMSNGYRKRGVGLMMLKHVKNPIKLAREVLIRGERDDGGGAQDHCEYSGDYVEGLSKAWGLEMCDQSYFWTRKKWEEHRRGLKEDEARLAAGLDGISDWEKDNYIPLGTCGAVVLDSFGTICVATSTGGLTNKIPGRIGDTPTMGAGYWAEEWVGKLSASGPQMLYQAFPGTAPLDKLSRGDLSGLLNGCLPSISSPSMPTQQSPSTDSKQGKIAKPSFVRHAVGMSGSGNGDTFIRMAAARTVAAKSRFTPTTLSSATTWMSGPGGELQKSAGDRWGHVHEGVGGIIGIELVDQQSTVICDYNCGGMFRAWTEADGKQKCLIFRQEGWESGPESWVDWTNM